MSTGALSTGISPHSFLGMGNGAGPAIADQPGRVVRPPSAHAPLPPLPCTPPLAVSLVWVWSSVTPAAATPRPPRHAPAMPHEHSPCVSTGRVGGFRSGRAVLATGVAFWCRWARTRREGYGGPVGRLLGRFFAVVSVVGSAAFAAHSLGVWRWRLVGTRIR